MQPKQLSERVAELENNIKQFEQWSKGVKSAVDELQSKIAELVAVNQALISVVGRDNVQAALDEIGRLRLEKARQDAFDKEEKMLEALRERVELGVFVQALEVAEGSIVLCRRDGEVPEPALIDMRKDTAASVLLKKSVGDVVGKYTVLMIFNPTDKVAEG